MKKRTYVLWKKLLTRLLVVSAVLGALYVYFFTGALTIRDYLIIGAPAPYEEDLKRQLGFLAEQKLFWFLPGNRVITYHDEEMRTAIMEVLPNTKDIEIHPSGLHTLTIKLAQHQPLFSVSDTHAISTEGVVYQEIVSVDGFPRLEVSSSTEVTPEKLLLIAELSKNVSDVLYEVKFVTFDEYDDVRLLDARRKSAVILPPVFDKTKIWSNIVSAIDTEPLKGKLTRELGNLDYLDTRFGNKVFYKFTNAEDTVIIPEPQEDDAMATTTVQ